MKAEKITVPCPKCGHEQKEPASAYSSVCKKCGQHFRIQEGLAAASQIPKPGPATAKETRSVTCFKCGTDLDVPLSAQSTMCKRCSSHVDLKDYEIRNTVSKNFKTKGRFSLEEGGCLLNTDSIAGEFILRGKVLGRIVAETLEIHDSGEIRGHFLASRLVIPIGTHFRWPEIISLRSAHIEGEFVGNLVVEDAVRLMASARVFGNITAGSISMQSGAVLVGQMKIGAAQKNSSQAQK
ncbi:MAG TPA: polymer-forming cytoskeletal protein [Candidatus Saccharimonadales bacterium]|nr:polymer-forming cytoskeletal protein [Candidatus Saccharimonadales bacterium]